MNLEKQLESCGFGKRKKQFIQQALKSIEKKGTKGSFTRWCRSRGHDGVTNACIKEGKRSKSLRTRRRAIFAQNIRGKKSRFGRKRKSTKRTKSRSRVVKIFKTAAKKCRGCSNYRVCMKKTLRKMHSKRGACFGKKKHRKVKKPSAILIKKCKKHHIKVSIKRGTKRVYKKVSVLKKLLRHKMRKSVKIVKRRRVSKKYVHVKKANNRT